MVRAHGAVLGGPGFNSLWGLSFSDWVPQVCYCWHHVVEQVSGKSRLAYLERHEDINTYQSVSFLEGRHVSVIMDIVYEKWSPWKVWCPLTRITTMKSVMAIDENDHHETRVITLVKMVRTDKGDYTGNNVQCWWECSPTSPLMGRITMTRLTNGHYSSYSWPTWQADLGLHIAQLTMAVL